MFDPDLDVIVTVDSCTYGLGAMLSQIKDGHEITIECASRTLSDAEKKYSVGEKEALACVWACEKWHVYLWGRPFTLRTDHKALITLLSKGTDRQSLRISRWSARLMKYNYKMEFKKGVENYVADALSRLPVAADKNDYDYDDEIICQVMCDAMCTSVTLNDLQKSVDRDPLFSDLKFCIQNGWSKGKIGENLKPFYPIKDDLCVYNGLVMRNHRFVIPNELTSKLVQLAHESHQGITRTKQRLRELYWWPKMDEQVENLVKSCIVCQSNDKSAKTHFAPLKPVSYPDKPWTKLAMDIVGPFEMAKNECRFAITLIDYNSKWPEVAFTSSVPTSKIILFLRQIFSREGFPEEIITDHGVQFTSKEFESYLAERGIKHGYSSIYYPESNGAIERFNGVLKNIVQSAIITGKPWQQSVTEFLAVYRATLHAITGKSPSLLLHGRRMRTKLDIVGGDFSKCVKNSVHKKVEQKQNKYKMYTDRKRSAKHPTFKIGDWVRVRKPGFIVKGDQRYSEPVQILKQPSSHTFHTSDNKTWNVSKLSKCNPPNTFDCSDLEVYVQPQSSPPVLRRSGRIRRRPNWLNDYVTY